MCCQSCCRGPHNTTKQILMSQVLVREVPFFKITFDDVVINHIDHKYIKEMSSKSDMVLSSKMK